MKRKVSLQRPGRSSSTPVASALNTDVLDLFFDTGVIFHEVPVGAMPDLICGFKVIEATAEASGYAVRRVKDGEEPDVEISAVEHLSELEGRWLPCPYQLSSPLCVQLWLAREGRSEVRAMLAVDTTEITGSGGRHLDAHLDAGRPFRALDRSELGGFLDDAEVRNLMRDLQRGSGGRAPVERAPFKLAALLETLAPMLPRIRFRRLEELVPVPVSLVLDFGNSRSTAVLVEHRDGDLAAVPLALRDTTNPFRVTEESFGSRITLLPNAFDKTELDLAVGAAFELPSLARLGREALDRALETPHRFQCSLSGPKRYLWDDRPTEQPWHFAVKHGDEYRRVSGRVLKHVPDHGDGVELREDGPSTPADPRYAPRSMMLLALVEILQQALSQINSLPYRAYQGREGLPRVLRHLVLTHPSGMRREELEVYEALVRNAVILACHYLHIKPEHRPNWNAEAGRFDPFLVSDEALAAQMVYVYQEIVHSFGGSMEELVRIYGKGETLRVASLDLGGGTSDVMIAEYRDEIPGTGTALHVTPLFQDGLSIAGDDVCRAICEDIILEQVLHQLPSGAARRSLAQLLAEGDAGYGAEWRTLRSKLVPYFWLPLSRCYWAIAEGFSIPQEHNSERFYPLADVWKVFEQGPSSTAVLNEADEFFGRVIDGWPGLHNLLFRFDLEEVERSIARILREPLRKYADIIAQFDVDLLVLAGRTSKLKMVRSLLVDELPVLPPRIKMMADFEVGAWYPSKWRSEGRISDPKSTVAAGASILHLAKRNQLPGMLIEGLDALDWEPVYGLYQPFEPHIPTGSELFREGKISPEFLYTKGMMVGFRNVDSQEMDGSPLFEVLPTNPQVEAALLQERVRMKFRLTDDGEIEIAEVRAQRDTYSFEPHDFMLRLRTSVADRYWLDSGRLETRNRRLLSDEDEPTAAAGDPP